MLIRLLIIAFICVNAANSFAWERPQISDMLQLSKIGLVKIIVTGLNNKQAVQDYGSGFVITPSGFVVSAAHLFPDTLQDLSITGWLAFLKNDDAAQRQNLSALTLVWKDLGLDVALLRFLEPPAGMRPLAVTSEPPKPGETLYVLGFPGGQNLSTAYPAVYQGSSTPSRFQFQGISNRGNSGGPILNAAGYVVGIVSETEDKINQTPITNTYRGVPTEKLPIPKGFSVSTVWPIYLSPDDLPGPSTSNNDLSKQSLSAESRACKISVPEAWNFRRSPELGFLVAPPTDSALLNAHFQFEFIVRKKEAYVEKLQTLLNSERFWPAPHGMIPLYNQSIVLLKENIGRPDLINHDVPFIYTYDGKGQTIFRYLPRYFGNLQFRPEGVDSAFVMCNVENEMVSKKFLKLCEPFLAQAVRHYFDSDNPCLPGSSSP